MIKSRFDQHPLRNTTGFLLILVLLFLIGDYVMGQSRLTKIAGRPHPYYHHDLKRNFSDVVEWGKTPYPLNTNSKGFVDRVKRQVKDQSDQYRILMIGDSFTEGVGYPYDDTFIGMFAAMLKNPRIEVLNAGVKSYSPKLYFLKIKYLLEENSFQFDELFVFIDLSDIQDEIVYQDFSPGRGDIKYRVKSVVAFLKQNFYFLNRIISSAEVLRMRILPPRVASARSDMEAENHSGYDFWERYHQDRIEWLYAENVYRIWGKKGLELATSNMEKLYQLCQSYGIKMHIVVYPWPEEILRGNINSLMVRSWEIFAREHGIGFLNLYPLFINNKMSPQAVIDQYYISGDSHWIVPGHRFVSQALFKYWQQTASHP